MHLCLTSYFLCCTVPVHAYVHYIFKLGLIKIHNPMEFSNDSSTTVDRDIYMVPCTAVHDCRYKTINHKLITHIALVEKRIRQRLQLLAMVHQSVVGCVWLICWPLTWGLGLGPGTP